MPDSSPHIKRNGLDEIAARSDLTRIVVFYRQEGDHQRYVEYHPDTLRQLVEQLETAQARLAEIDTLMGRDASEFIRLRADRDGLEEQLEALRQALRDSWDDYANAIDEHTSEEVRKEARHAMLRRFAAFQDEGWLYSNPAKERDA